MRIRAFIVLGLASLAAAGLTIVACGGEEETPAPGTTTGDSGSDASQEADGASPDGATPEDCDKSKDFLADIPDASLADGASSSGACVSCLQTNCKPALDLCNGDCACREFVGSTLSCVAQGTDSFINCATAAAGETPPSDSVQAIGLGLYNCANTNCTEACALDQLIPPDGGPADGGGDAGSDAGEDDAGQNDAGQNDAGDAGN